MSKPLKGWLYIHKETPRTSRTRRSTSKESIILKREADDFEIKVGDSILFQDGSSTEIGLISEIKFGTGTKFLDILVIWLTKGTETNELLITPYVGELAETDILDKVNLLSEDEFSEIVLDESNMLTTFMVRRGSNIEGNEFTEVFDYRELYKKLESGELLEFIRDKTIKAYKSPRKGKSETPKKIKEEKTTPKGDSESPKIDYIDHSEPESPDSDSDSFEPESPESPTKRRKPQRNSVKKRHVDNKSPIKDEKKKQNNDESHKYMNSILSPLKKGFKIKPNVLAPKVSSLSPRKPSGVSVLNPTSDAFKELKAKLHTSAKLNSLPGREEETYQLLDKISMAIETETGSCVYVSGTPGLGKTATIRVVISQLRELVDEGIFKDFDYLEINGLKLLSPNVAYETLWKEIGGFNVSSSNAAILLEQHFATKLDTRKPLIVLMDELDQIVTKNQNVMYNFFNWPSYPNSKLIVIAVANTMDLPERVLSNKISSRLGLNRIQFTGYSFDQLGEIIRVRLEMITKSNRRKVVMDKEAVGFALRKVASVSGDARRALTICRRAVEIAEKEYLAQYSNEEIENQALNGEDKENENLDIGDQTFHVKITHISKAIVESVNSPMAQFLSSLSFASKLLLQCVLLRKKRSGLAENSLGDIIDEMKTTLTMLTSKESSTVLDSLDSNISLVDLLYGNTLFDVLNGKINIRVLKFKQLVNELVENGILLQQNVSGERYRMIHLNISEEEVEQLKLHS